MFDSENFEKLKALHKSAEVANLVLLAKGLIGPEDIRPGGVLRPEAARRFISLVWEDPFFSQVSRRLMTSLKADGGVLDIASRSMVRVAEGVEPADGQKVGVDDASYTLHALDQQLFVDLKYSFLRDNASNPGLRTEIENAFATRVRGELTDLGFNGTLDDNSAGFLTLNKGWVQIAKDNAPGGQQLVIDPATNGWIDTLAGLLDLLPDQFLGQAKFIMNGKDANAYALEVGKHVTGEAVIADMAKRSLIAFEIVPVTYMPRNTVMLTAPKNLVLGVNQDITRYRNNNDRKRVVEYTWDMYTDFEIAAPQALVLGKPV